MNTNRIPESYRPLLHLAHSAAGAAAATEANLHLVYHPASAIASDRDQLEARQAAYLQARTAHATARAELRSPTSAARTFCADAVDSLKPILGRRWNVRWEAVGFLQGSLALPADPLVLLLELAGYLRQHPEHENAPLQITAAKADALHQALLSAGSTAAAARTAEADAKKARDAAFKALRQRLSGLRVELALLLAPDDARWVHFGFRRPADLRIPEPVMAVSARATAPEEAALSWATSRRARNYRVAWQLAHGPSEPIVVGLFADPGAVLTGLPPGKEIIVHISARNRSGESSPTPIRVHVEQATRLPVQT